jgi:hypothetical protein
MRRVMILSERLELIGPLDESHRRHLVAILEAQNRYEAARLDSESAVERAASELAEERRRALSDGWTPMELAIIGVTDL